MKTPSVILLLIFLISLTGCEEKASNKNPLHVENTTEIFTPTDIQKQKNKESYTIKKISPSKSNVQDEQIEGTFILSNTQNNTHKLTLSKKSLSISGTEVPLILLNLCSDTSSTCLAQLTSFSKLQKKYRKKLLIISVWVKNTNKQTKDILSQQKKASYFISNDSNRTNHHALISKVLGSLHIDKNTKLPLSVLYKGGSYSSHFEGAVPIEMITHDIQQAIQK